MTRAGRPTAAWMRRHGPGRWSAAACLALLLCACATPQTDALLRNRPVRLPAAAPPLQVPDFPQRDHQCGPAALAMVLDARGSAHVTPEQLTSEVFIPARQGSLTPEMLAAARRHGRLAVLLAPRLDAVLAEVADGTPVIVLLNLSLPWYPIWHYAVVVGYDVPDRRITLQSGGEPPHAISLRTFEHTWARSGHWAIAVTAPDKLPVSAAAAPVMDAAVALERVDPSAARRTYRAVTLRFPDQPQAWIGLGDAEYAQGDLAGAAAAFARATELDPQDADAWNNLADALAGLGQRCRAADAARRALSIGQPHPAQYAQTAAGIDGSGCPDHGLR